MLRAFRTITALVLLTLWLPATAHCSLGAALDSLASLCEKTCDHDSSGPHADACAPVESGDYRAMVADSHAPAPQLSEIACLACLHARILADAEPLAPPAWVKAHPLDWVPELPFSFRAALPARAPSLI